MDASKRIEQALNFALSSAEAPGAPPLLATALRYAVFPGGARVRPRLCLAVARACGDDQLVLADAAGAAIELLHCGSLVHDDLPCFDDAATRRGKPSVHRAFGERIAVLVGDALIVHAFQAIARAGAHTPERIAPLVQTIARCVGSPHGIIAGQAWECESSVNLQAYQRAKTGSLFVAATAAGAICAGAEPSAWRELGERLGEAYQVADDIRDVAADPAELGKPIGQDLAHGRPSSARELGLPGAVRHFERLLSDAADAIPGCPGAGMLRTLIALEAQRLIPKELQHAA